MKDRQRETYRLRERRDEGMRKIEGERKSAREIRKRLINGMHMKTTSKKKLCGFDA